MSSVGEEFPREQRRVRELLQSYRDVHAPPRVNCSFAVASIEAVLWRAEDAMASGDPVLILRSYAELKECN